MSRTVVLTYDPLTRIMTGRFEETHITPEHFKQLLEGTEEVTGIKPTLLDEHTAIFKENDPVDDDPEG